jgi:hypothetical protein
VPMPRAICAKVSLQAGQFAGAGPGRRHALPVVEPVDVTGTLALGPPAVQDLQEFSSVEYCQTTTDTISRLLSTVLLYGIFASDVPILAGTRIVSAI